MFLHQKLIEKQREIQLSIIFIEKEYYLFSALQWLADFFITSRQVCFEKEQVYTHYQIVSNVLKNKLKKLSPLEKYQLDLKRHDFQRDQAQENAVKHLQRLYEDLIERPSPKKGLVNKALKIFASQPTKPIKGLYFWGGVGRGKTYLVDTFHDALPIEKKMRVHFHRFMHRVHQELKSLDKQSDPLKIVAKRIASETDVICFDEFFVSDITDAMLLGTLFEELFSYNMVLVATSNIVPDELYKNGLQRARFLPAIELINQKCDVVNVDSGVDYRLRTLQQAEIYHTPLDQQAEINLLRYFEKLKPDPGKTQQTIEIEGREIKTRRVADGVLLIEFREMCDGPRSQVDYMEISREFQAVLISNVVQMSAAVDDIARRFIAMVDEFYERNVKLIMSAAVPMEDLYAHGQLEFEFKRCLSRLQEMQSEEYLAKPHIP